MKSARYLPIDLQGPNFAKTFSSRLIVQKNVDLKMKIDKYSTREVQYRFSQQPIGISAKPHTLL
jgi:hypothetical protein